jgi:GH35 family endo-1,4-beta-xylanase
MLGRALKEPPSSLVVPRLSEAGPIPSGKNGVFRKLSPKVAQSLIVIALGVSGCRALPTPSVDATATPPPGQTETLPSIEFPSPTSFQLIPVLTETPTPTSIQPTLTPTQTPTPSLPTIEVDGLKIPDPKASNPELFDLTSPDSPIVQFANAFGVKPEEVGDLTHQLLTGVDGKQFVVMITGDLAATADFDESGTPLLIAEQKDGVWGWTVATTKNIAMLKNIHVGFSVSVMDSSEGPAIRNVITNGNSVVIADALWKIPYSANDSTAPSQGQINTNSLKTALKIAENNRLLPTVFHLLWGAPYTLPDWLLNGNYNREQLQTFQTDYIKTVVLQNKGKVDAWVVVNEPFGGAGQRTFWNQQLGPSDDWIVNAFKTASEADPQTRLILNDFGMEIPNSWLWHQNPNKNEKMLSLLQRIREMGINAEAGFQMHLIGSEYRSQTSFDQLIANFNQNIQEHARRSIPINITEMDVNMQDVPLDEQPILLEKIYNAYTKTALEGGITNINFFGYKDDQSWLETSQGLKNANPTLFNDDLSKKMAYYGVLKAMFEANK